MARDISYSRFVRITKVALPMIALALLSTVFLLAERPDPSRAAAFATVDITSRAREQRITTPRFSGQSIDGAAYSLIADSARPELGNPRKMQAEGISLAVDGLQGNRTLHLRSVLGAVDTERGDVRLLGDVAVRSSLGFVLQTDALLAGFREFNVMTPGEVHGSSPFGKLEAGSMRMTTQGEEDAQLLLFENGVKLLYDPSGL